MAGAVYYLAEQTPDLHTITSRMLRQIML
jgi:hypothetical protein